MNSLLRSDIPELIFLLDFFLRQSSRNADKRARGFI